MKKFLTIALLVFGCTKTALARGEGRGDNRGNGGHRGPSLEEQVETCKRYADMLEDVGGKYIINVDACVREYNSPFGTSIERINLSKKIRSVFSEVLTGAYRQCPKNPAIRYRINAMKVTAIDDTMRDNAHTPICL